MATPRLVQGKGLASLDNRNPAVQLAIVGVAVVAFTALILAAHAFIAAQTPVLPKRISSAGSDKLIRYAKFIRALDESPLSPPDVRQLMREQRGGFDSECPKMAWHAAPDLRETIRDRCTDYSERRRLAARMVPIRYEDPRLLMHGLRAEDARRMIPVLTEVMRLYAGCVYGVVPNCDPRAIPWFPGPASPHRAF